jgi:hypothetical protein
VYSFQKKKKKENHAFKRIHMLVWWEHHDIPKALPNKKVTGLSQVDFQVSYEVLGIMVLCKEIVDF